MARDRKRARQRRARRSAAAGRGRAEGARTAPAGRPGEDAAARPPLPGALEHASADVDEFDAALLRGAGGAAETPPAPLEEEGLQGGAGDEALAPPQPIGDGERGEDGARELAELDRVARAGARERPSAGAPPRGGNRAMAFLRASWAELQRVQWPDRRQVTQATAVVLGFVIVAGVYLGVADFLAKEIVELVL